MIRTLAAVIVAVFAIAAPALAATPVVVGQAALGGTPDVAVDPTGRAHITWDDGDPPFPMPDLARYCQLPRGGAACENAEAFSGRPDSIFGRVHVFLPVANQVSVFYGRCCGAGEGTRILQSGNNGLDFAAEDLIGDPGVGVNASEAVYGPGDRVSLLAEVITAGATVQSSDFTGVNALQAVLGSQSSGEGAIGLHTDGRPVVVYQLQSSPNWTFVWRQYTGPMPGSDATFNDPANWSAEAPLATTGVNAADGPALAGGPNGLFLFWKQSLPDRGWVQKFTGSGWTPPVLIGDGRPFNDVDLHQDAAGRLHAVWNAYTDQELRYRWSDDGVNWSPVVDIARGESYPQVRVAAAGDHQGFAVWNRGGPDVVAVPLEALPDPPGGGGGGGADTTDPTIGGFDVGDSTLLPGQGTSFTFNSSEAGRAVLTIQKRVNGRKVTRRGRRRCVPQSRARLRRVPRQRRCKTWKRIGQIRKNVVPGRNRIVFSGRIAGRRLKPGLYRALLRITDSAGNVSRTESVRFRVIKRRRRG